MGALSSEEARRVAEALWSVEWVSDTDGYLECPGLARHTRPDGPRDCRIMLEGGKPPTMHCVHSSCGDEVSSANFRLRSALGKAEKHSGWRPPAREWQPEEPTTPREPPPAYDRAALERFAGAWAGVVDLAWLANRSAADPALVTSTDFLRRLYLPGQGERVIVFTNEFSQGEAVWPNDALPQRGKKGVWFLAQPVDGEFRPNPRSRKREGGPVLSRRSEESVREWRFMVLESDEAPARLWLGALVQLPLQVAAIYSSGGKSVHALIRVGGRLKEEWERSKSALKAGLVTLGADAASLSGVRLTRLPGCWREGKATRDGGYARFPEPRLQKLLYLNPLPDRRPIVELVARRDVLRECLAAGDEISDRIAGVSVHELEEFTHRAKYYSPVSERCREMAEESRELLELKGAPLRE